MPNEPLQLMNVAEAAAALGVVPATVHRWINEGRLERYPGAAGTVMLTAETVAACQGKRAPGRKPTQPK